ncbi:FUSC family protein [Synechococcus sp. Tobar12-5m-g]|uniref:FUSC family protein n=1 Tax=unclassified Synechococcus TaxID=2626047 RepID=UPI0020CEADCE|nr:MULTISPECIES: FUSC family protein [unclassified Synechococcus]MCP9772879.1 FUSC family protein [Synechococcus sp. Tobar12-5m-g]MCP9873655.1 FUSC family protein [Synechococcus sp. Cruz CV-v-12]
MKASASGASTFLTAPSAGPNLRLGLRTTLAAVPPLLGASLLQEPALIWMALGGLYVNMADTGGAYRTKGTAMALASLLGAVALGAGIGLATWPWLCVPAMFAVGLGCGLLSLYGNAGALIGLVTAWCFLIGINVAGPDPAKALGWSLLYLAGGAWATLLAVAVWPLRPYRPVRVASADALRSIAHFLSLACPAPGQQRASEERLFQEKLRVRGALASARSTLAETRCGRLGASPADGAFTRLIETADRLFVTGAAISDLLASIPAPEASPIQRRMQVLNRRCVAALLQIEQALLGRGPLPALQELEEEARRIAGAIEELLPHAGGGGAAAFVLQQAQASQAHWIATLDQAGEAIPLAARNRRSTQGRRPSGQMGAAVVQGWATLRANLTLESSVFRHGLRFGAASAVAVGVYTLFALPIGYWITLTVSVILRPSAGESLARTSQRVLGTVLGGMLAIVLATLFPHPLALVLLLVPLTVVMMAVLPVNYGLFVFFLTPWIVLYKDIAQPGDWSLALWRIANTLIGAGLALAAIHLVLPRWEREQLPARLAASLRCTARFAQDVLDRVLATDPTDPRPPATPAEVRLAMGNAQVSIQRYLSERVSHRPMALPLMAFLQHSQRLIDALVVLGSGGRPLDAGPAPASALSLRDQVLTTLAALASALECGVRPGPLPDLHRPDKPAYVLLKQLAPLMDPILGLRNAVEAWSAGETSAELAPAGAVEGSPRRS